MYLKVISWKTYYSNTYVRRVTLTWTNTTTYFFTYLGQSCKFLGIMVSEMYDV